VLSLPFLSPFLFPKQEGRKEEDKTDLNSSPFFLSPPFPFFLGEVREQGLFPPFSPPFSPPLFLSFPPFSSGAVIWRENKQPASTFRCSPSLFLFSPFPPLFEARGCEGKIGGCPPPANDFFSFLPFLFSFPSRTTPLPSKKQQRNRSEQMNSCPFSLPPPFFPPPPPVARIEAKNRLQSADFAGLFDVEGILLLFIPEETPFPPPPLSFFPFSFSPFPSHTLNVGLIADYNEKGADKSIYLPPSSSFVCFFLSLPPLSFSFLLGLFISERLKVVMDTEKDGRRFHIHFCKFRLFSPFFFFFFLFFFPFFPPFKFIFHRYGQRVGLKAALDSSTLSPPPFFPFFFPSLPSPFLPLKRREKNIFCVLKCPPSPPSFPLFPLPLPPSLLEQATKH